MRSGRLRALAVTGAQRSPQYPEAPTFREQGIGFMDDVDAWYAVMAPGRTPSELIGRLGELAALIKSDLARWAKVVADANIRMD